MASTMPRPGAETGDPLSEGELFRLHNGRCGRQLQATCELWTHRFGWELRLIVNDGRLPRSELCRTRDAVRAVSDTWKAAMVERGWA